jgi:hypothetical protein
MCCRNDGFGAQYLALISVYAFSVVAKRTLCTAPFHVVPHFSAKGADVQLGALDLFSFVGGPGFGPVARPETPRKYTAEEDIARLAPDLQPYHLVAPQVRAWYDAAPLRKPTPHFRRSTFNGALHIRRGDVAPGGAVPKPHLVISDADIAACVATVMRQVPSSAVLHIYSQGNESDFTFLDRWRPRLHAEQHTQETSEAQTLAIKSVFHHMVSADALIIARSSLSRVAGFLSRGRVFAPERRNRIQAPSFIARLENCL